MSVTNTQYEKVAAKYEASLQIPVRRCDTTNFLKAVEPIQGMKVLDLATGTGYFARAMAKMGAAHVTGVDVSKAMLEIAGRVTADDHHHPLIPPGVVDYEIGDVFNKLSLASCPEASCDLVTGIWCLNYAGDRDMMRRAWENIAHFLKPGGKFVGIVPDSSFPSWLTEDEVYYGFSCKYINEVKDGCVVKITLHAKDQPVSFQAFMLDEVVFRNAAEEVGMVEITIEDPKIMPDFEGVEDEEYWNRFLAKPLFKVMTAVKA